ncbi:MAG: hypothetical protein WAW63_02785 [Candidatus Saccharimonadales bacterium]
MAFIQGTSITTPMVLKASYHEGLHGIQGDPEALRDIGIPVGSDDFERHVTSGHEVRRVLTQGLGKMCGDCCITIQPGKACAHMRLDEQGKPNILG